MRFYRGLAPALLQGPLSRFGDTAANAGGPLHVTKSFCAWAENGWRDTSCVLLMSRQGMDAAQLSFAKLQCWHPGLPASTPAVCCAPPCSSPEPPSVPPHLHFHPSCCCQKTNLHLTSPVFFKHTSTRLYLTCTSPPPCHPPAQACCPCWRRWTCLWPSRRWRPRGRRPPSASCSCPSTPPRQSCRWERWVGWGSEGMQWQNTAGQD